MAELPPADQQRLAPLLSAALSLRQPLAPLRPAFRAGLQATLAELEEGMSPRGRATAHPPTARRVVGVLLAAALLVMGSFGLALAASYSVPGDALYPLKQGLEQVVAALTPTVARPELVRRLAAERLREAGLLLAQGAERAEVLATLDEARALLAQGAVAVSGPSGPPGPVPRSGPPSWPSSTPLPTSQTLASPELAQTTAAALSATASAYGAAQPSPLAPGLPLTTVTPAAPPTPTLPPPSAPPPTPRPKPTRESTPAATPTPSPSPTPAGVGIEGVVLRDGTAVVGALVSAWTVEPGQPCAAGTEPVREAVTDDQGRYALEGLDPGTYQISAEGGPLCLPRRWFAGAADLAVPDPCGGGALKIELPLPGSRLQLVNLLYDPAAGGCPVGTEGGEPGGQSGPTDG